MTEELDYPKVSVEFTEDVIRVMMQTDGWEKSIKWCEIVRICYKTYDYGAPDFILLFTSEGHNPDAIIPKMETGGEALWAEIQRRGLVPRREAEAAQSSVKSWDITCWPEHQAPK